MSPSRWNWNHCQWTKKANTPLTPLSRTETQRVVKHKNASEPHKQHVRQFQQPLFDAHNLQWIWNSPNFEHTQRRHRLSFPRQLNGLPLPAIALLVSRKVLGRHRRRLSANHVVSLLMLTLHGFCAIMNSGTTQMVAKGAVVRERHP